MSASRSPPPASPLICEGLARISRPPSSSSSSSKKALAFYNPAQVINRDLSVCAAHVECSLRPSPPSLLEALSATGLRSMRYRLEVPQLGPITANDLSESAVAQIRSNAQLNGVQGVEARQGDCSSLMYSLPRHYDIIDVDPYGTPAPFLDSCLQSVSDGGLLALTATDMIILCGRDNPESAFSKYGGVPLKGARFCHEFAIRLVLAAAVRKAAVYGRHVEPLCCVFIDYYLRCFVRVGSSRAATRDNITNIGTVSRCLQCGTHHTHPTGTQRSSGLYAPSRTDIRSECEVCGGHMVLGGPIWLGPLYDPDTVASYKAEVERRGPEQLASHSKLTGLLSVLQEELIDVPLFYHLPTMCHALKMSTPPMDVVRSAIVRAGHRVSLSHCSAESIKTDMPASHLWDILKWYRRLAKPPAKEPKPHSPAAAILAKPPSIPEPDFSLLPGARVVKSSARYVKVDGWGPKKRAKTTKAGDEEKE